MIEKEIGITREDKHALDLIYAIDVYNLDLKRKNELTKEEQEEMILLKILRKSVSRKVVSDEKLRSW